MAAWVSVIQHDENARSLTRIYVSPARASEILVPR